MARKPKILKSQISEYLSFTSELIKTEEGENLPLYVLFEFPPCDEPNHIVTDEAEAILAYDDGFAVLSNAENLPHDWLLSPPDPEGNAIFKIPAGACIGMKHRKLRRRRYFENVRNRRYAA